MIFKSREVKGATAERVRILEEKVRLLEVKDQHLTLNSPLIDIKSRLDELELWKAKIHALTIEKTPRGKEKLNKIGKRIF